ncbi:MAG: hypothetical protein IT247_08050 [Bacteroidia bacterium]|nr:hypothetical protein [Bacteroidia bacterium]
MKKVQVFAFLGILMMAAAGLMAFNVNSETTTHAGTPNAYLSIIAVSAEDSLSLVLSAKGKTFKTLNYPNRETAFDLTPALNWVLELEKQGYDLMSQSTAFDSKHDHMVYTFIMRKKGIR